MLLVKGWYNGNVFQVEDIRDGSMKDDFKQVLMHRMLSQTEANAKVCVQAQ